MGATLAERLIGEDPRKIDMYLQGKGYSPSPDYNALIQNINHFISEAPDEELYELLKMHPDNDIFEEIVLITNQRQEQQHGANFHRQNIKRSNKPQHNCCGSYGVDGFNNCAGCGGQCGGHMNATGNGSAVNWTSGFGQTAFYAALFAITTIALVSLARNPREAK